MSDKTDSSKEFEELLFDLHLRSCRIGEPGGLSQTICDEFKDGLLAAHHKATQERVREARIEELDLVLEHTTASSIQHYIQNRLFELEEKK